MIPIPLYSNIVVRQFEAEEKSAGGEGKVQVYIAEVAREKPARGIVVAVGPGTEREDGSLRPLTVTVGQDVAFKRYLGHDVKIGQETFTIMDEDAILCIMPKTAT